MTIFDSYHLQIRGHNPGIYGPRVMVTLHANKLHVGTVFFWHSLPETEGDSVDSSGVVTINLPISVMNSVLDVLRHEGPLKVDWSPSGLGLISTWTQELVGDEEN